MTFAIISCTQQADYKQTLLYKSLAKLEKTNNLQLLDKLKFYTQNKRGLCTAYNDSLIRDSENVIKDIMIFAHDDISVDDAGFISKLEEGHKIYDIIGVAGGLNPTLKAPALWHIMCGGFQGGNLRGFAGHYLPDGTTSITNFGREMAAQLPTICFLQLRSFGLDFGKDYLLSSTLNMLEKWIIFCRRHSSVDPNAPTMLRPGFKSQAQHLHMFQFIFKLSV